MNRAWRDGSGVNPPWRDLNLGLRPDPNPDLNFGAHLDLQSK